MSALKRRRTDRSTILCAPRPEMELPENWNSLEEFVEWWLAAKMPWNMPAGVKTAITDIAWTLPIFRHKQYQVEMYMLNKIFHINQHRHPGVEVVQMSLDIPGLHWGEFFGSNKGDTPHGRQVDPNAIVVPGSLLTFEKWDEGIKPSVICAVWEGETFGPVQRNTIKEYYPYVDVSQSYVTNDAESMRQLRLVK